MLFWISVFKYFQGIKFLVLVSIISIVKINAVFSDKIIKCWFNSMFVSPI